MGSLHYIGCKEPVMEPGWNGGFPESSGSSCGHTGSQERMQSMSLVLQSVTAHRAR